MPHLTLEYSANLSEPDPSALFAALHESLAVLGFALDDCKSRAYRCETYRVGTGAKQRGFAHLTLAVLDRRSAETQHAAGALALHLLEQSFACTECDFDLTF